jgi:hypothetical protein
MSTIPVRPAHVGAAVVAVATVKPVLASGQVRAAVYAGVASFVGAYWLLRSVR